MTTSSSGRAVPVARATRTGLIALAVPHLEEPYFAELGSRLVRGAEERGLAVLIVQTEGEHAREVDVANGVGLPAVDGLIHIPRSLTVADLTRRTAPGPLVLLGEHIQVSPFTHITIDNRAAARTAAEHLIEVGCRRIAYVGRRDARPSDAADRRHVGYVEALTAAGLSVVPELTAQVEAFTAEEGERLTQAMLAAGLPFDGIVCSNDSLALGALAALHAAGRRVPDDVAVIGIDDIRAARFAVPALSTMAPDHDQLVDAAFTELERQLTSPPGADLPVRHVTIPAALVRRASTARR
ncbi:LacI family DNA-binding transcriptional regulator [Microbacterium hydrocarbonoxydans]|uniref:LacI family DNA-binding transcriptional regulator n=1 Tax=Microbacterium hydrocarbonoxydans TaxID=273678 RepID=UPI0007BC2798|nr:substrate-binding domain-containing protein [Microbacterium hydrocarbonoxydans]GAT71558.1 transcriptional regulator [Microbacterium sp. HM58-2]